MKDNIYYKARYEIMAVSDDLDVPVDVATDIVRRRHGWSDVSTVADLQAWRALCREYQLAHDKTLADLFR